MLTRLPPELIEHVMLFCYIDNGPTWRYMSPNIDLLIKLDADMFKNYSYWRWRINTIETEWYYGTSDETNHWNYSNPTISQK
tara:strand:+ start:230 stop:475 length:246 start_codon:yes stop_codon:yes gene_type:complete